MKPTPSRPQLVASGATALGLAVMVLGCGARGEPLPPLHPIPPAIPELRVGQIGIEATLSFVAPPARFMLGAAEVAVDGVELLMVTERYAAITPEMLAVALDQERSRRLRDAREAVGRVRDDRRRRRREELLRVATERALAAGEEPPTLESLGLLREPDKEDEGEEGADEPREALTEDELLLRKVPRNVLTTWRDADLLPNMVLDAARRLAVAVDVLWDELGLPMAIVDLSEPPAMPEPRALVTVATHVARGLAYEGSMDVVTFLERTNVVASFPYEDLATKIVDARVLIRHPVGIPSPGPVRTRYYFAVRITSSDKDVGAVAVVATLAPIAVPVPPSGTSASVSPLGVTLQWLPPGGNLWGERLAPEQLRYNVYRRRSDELRFPSQPLNTEPLETTTFTDTAMGWGSSYVYMVRAQDAPVVAEAKPSTAPVEPGTVSPRKEGARDESAEVDVVDTFPPDAIGGLEATRAASRVTVRWTSPTASIVAGYRVYRHQAPVASILEPDPPASAAEPTDAADVADAAEGADVAVPAAAAAATPPDVDPEADLCPPMPDLSAAMDSSEAPETDPDSTPDDEDKSVGKGQRKTEGSGEGESEGKDEGEGESEGEDESVGQDEGEGRRQIGGRRRQLNALTGAGWDLLTPTLITAQLYIDPVAERSVSWLYLVSAVDEAGNDGPLACVGVPAEPER